MDKYEYTVIQNNLSSLLHETKRKNLGLSMREWEIYNTAVMAYKSVLSNYSPSSGK